MTQHRLASPVLLMVAALSAAPAFAQAPPTPATPLPPTAPRTELSAADCAPSAPAPKGKGVTTGEAHEPLGDQLAKSDGVLCPPANVDPEIRAPTPGGGKTPVIPPPGSPGGNPNLIPK